MTGRASSGLREVRVLVGRELRSALRERGVLLSAIGIPLLLYPMLLWSIFAAVGFVRGQEERHPSRVVVFGTSREKVEEVVAVLRMAGEPGSRFQWVEPGGAGREELEERVATGEIDVAIEVFPSAGEAASLVGNFRIELLWDSTVGRSNRARERVLRELDRGRLARVEDEVARLEIDPSAWLGFRMVRMNLASKTEMGAFLLGLVAPLLTVLMVAVGCFYSAIDTTAGERERSTWETSMTLGVSRSRVMLAKYLVVALLGWMAGLLNLLALSFTLKAILAPSVGEGADLRLAIPWSAWLLVAPSAALLALFIAAGMMIFAAFAHTFKEGQSMVTPFYLICILPALIVQSPDLELDASWALVPIANVVLVFRDAIVGTYRWPWIGLTLIVEWVTVVACLALARRIMADEDVMTGVFEGGFLRFLRRRILGRSTASEQTASGTSR